MRFLNITVAATAAMLIAGCGGDEAPPGGVLACNWSGTPGGGGSCSAAAAYGGQSGNSAVVLTSDGPSSLNVTMILQGHLVPGIYTGTTTGLSGSITLTNGSASYTTTTNTGNNPGTFSLVVTGVTTSASADGALVYSITATLDATIPAAAGSGASGTSTLHATVAPS
jgi:hypothetical protein